MEVNNQYAMYAPTIRNAPCATLITFITPKISVKPAAMRAYTPPFKQTEESDLYQHTAMASASNSPSLVR